VSELGGIIYTLPNRNIYLPENKPTVVLLLYHPTHSAPKREHFTNR
jgi:hypothetical protein